MTRLFNKVSLLVATGGLVLAAGCLPSNFWADKWGEIVNRSIFFVLNLLLAPTGIQI